MTDGKLPLWAEIPIALFALTGAGFSLVGALGLVRLKTFYARIHAPTLATTVGVWTIAFATVLEASVLSGRPTIKALVIPILMAITMPVTTIFLMRAALFRDRLAGKPVPPNLTHRNVRPVLPPPDDATSRHAPEAPIRSTP